MTSPRPVPLMVAPFQLDALDPPDTAGPKRKGRHAAKPAKKRWSWFRTFLVLVLVLILGAAGFVVVRLSSPVAAATVTPVLSPEVTVPESATSLPWTTVGQSAISVPSLAIAQKAGAEVPVPVASLTKIMTAYVILEDHPLAVGESGPDITMTQADVTDYDIDTQQDEANAAITVGEVLTEQQMLQGLLVHSANDFADALAVWDAGSIPAFVIKMNQTAAHLAMTQTTYADASGFSDNSVSTASDVLIVAARAMAIPAFAAIVKMPTVTLPVAGTLGTYTPLLGYLGVIGVKSGFTTKAGGCDVMAVERVVDGHQVMILTAVTGQVGTDQPNVLLVAGVAALTLADAVTNEFGSLELVHPGAVVAQVSANGHTVPAVASHGVNVLTWPGAVYRRNLVTHQVVKPGDAAGTRAGSILVTLGTTHVVVPARLGTTLPKETLLQRLF